MNRSQFADAISNEFDATQPHWHRIYVSAAAFAICFSLAYVGTDFLALKKPWYDPIARDWFWATKLGGVPMGYFGLWIYALIAGVLGAVVVWFGWRLLSGGRKLSDTHIALVAAWTGSAAALGMGYFAWHNWP